jgi:hypothetical protein
MFRILFLSFFVVSFLAGGLSAVQPQKPADDATKSVIGRWDVTVHQGTDTYPLWFEISEESGGLSGRLQPRGGHNRPLSEVAVSESTLSLKFDEMRLTAKVTGDSMSGEGTDGSNSFTWTAVRSPELPKPSEVAWGESIELFNGKDLDGWKPQNPSQKNFWSVENGVLVNTGRGVNLMTAESFCNFKRHIEVNCPEGSNSGIYLRGRYEVQVEDSHGEEPHNRKMGGIYGQVTPTSNPAKPADEWQEFDITILGRWVTVEFNGVTIIDDQEIPGITGGALNSRQADPGPILIQGDHGAISYRNIVLTPAGE